MKKLFTLFSGVLLFSATYGQSPQKLSYQAVIRNSSNNLVANTQIGMEINIRQGTPGGTVVYTEVQTPNTNANGLVSIDIGSGADFSTIDWANGPYFIETKTAVAPPLTTYTISGTTQLLSVPYALHAKTAETITGTITETDPTYTSSQASNITATDIVNLGNLSGTNTGDQDLGGLATTTSVTVALASKVDKETDKGLSTEDYTTAEKTKLAGIATGAEVNINADWNQTNSTADDYIKNKPAIPAAQVQTNWTATTGIGILLNKPANIDEDKTDDVTLTGNQTIAGNKTFTGTISVPSPVNATDVATKAYVDAFINQLSSKGVIVSDIDGNIYSTVRIGSQVWMAENLKTTRYADGTSIPLVNTTETWYALSASSIAYCWYNDDIAYKDNYGALYTWAAAMNGSTSTNANPSGIQGVCPTGWHLPSDAEWTQMENYLADNGYNYDGTTGGGGEKIAKSLASTNVWTSYSYPGTVGNTDYASYRNKSGFSALPGGFRNNNGSFYDIENFGDWWSATEYNGTSAWHRYIGYCLISFGNEYYQKREGYSVRCLRD